MAKEDKEEKKKEERFTLGQVATQTQPVILDEENPEEPLTELQALVEVLNNQQKLMKLLD